MLKIIIPSYKRAGVNHTIRFFPEEIVKEYVWIAVRDEEYDEYVNAHPGINIHNLGKDIDGIAETRQRINEQFSGKIMVLDDDVRFYQTKLGEHPPPSTKLPFIGRGKAFKTVEEYVEMFKYIEDLLDKYSLGTMRNLNFSRDRRWYPYVENTVCYWVFCINLDSFDFKNCNFRNAPPSGMCEDLYIFCDWFDKGNDFFTLVKWNVGEKTGQNEMEGGCNTPDRGIKLKKSYDEFVAMFPQYAKQHESNANFKTYGEDCKITVRTQLNPKKRRQDPKFQKLF